MHRVAQVAPAQEPRCAAQPLTREALLEVQLRKRPRALFGRGDAQREERALRVLAPAKRACGRDLLAGTLAALPLAAPFSGHSRGPGGAHTGGSAPAPGREQALGQSLRQREPARDQTRELHAHRAWRERREHGTQLLDDAVATLGTVECARLERALDSESHERDRSLHQRRHRLGAVVVHDLSRVGASRHRHHAQLELALGGEGRRAQHRLLPRAVRVERQQDRLRHARELAHLIGRQRSPHQAHGVTHASLVQGDRVGVALAQQDRPRTGSMNAGEVRAVEMAALVVELVVGRVQVLRPLLLAHRACAEAEHMPA